MSRFGRSWKKFQSLGSARSGISRGVRKAEGATVRHAHQFIISRWRNLYNVRRNIGVWLLGVGILILAMAAHFILLRTGYTAVAQVRGGTYAEGVVGRITTLNPLYATTAAEISASKLLFSSLFRYDDTGVLSGDLARGYKMDETGKQYTVSIRTDAHWHDGKPVTVDDVIFTIDILKKSTSGTAQADSWKGIDTKKIDADKIQFTLPAPYAPFPNALTFAIVPKHILAKTPVHLLRESKFGSAPVGSGPFSFHFMQQVADGQHAAVHLVRNNRYYLGAPKLERFQLHAYENATQLKTALQKQAISAASDIAPRDAAELRKNKQLVSHSIPLHSGVYALFNVTSSNLQDVRVRQALQVGTNIDKILKSIPHKPERLELPFLSSQVSGSHDIKAPVVDVAKANMLLDESGWKRGNRGVRTKDGQPLALRLVLVKDAEYEDVARGLGEQWKALGFEVQIKTVDTSDPTQNFVSTVLQPRDYDVLLHELVIGADPDVYAYWHSSQAVARGLNFANYTDGVSDDALASGRSRTNRALRDAKYRTFATHWLQQVPAIGLYRSSSIYVTRNGARAIDPSAVFVTPADRYSNVQFWTARTDTVYKTP